MSTNKPAVREPLFHLTKRAHIVWWKAWLIRLISIVLSLVVVGAVAFLLIEKLRNNPGRITEFYECFYNGSFSTKRRIWKFFLNTAVLQCIALALTPAFRMRFWNTGAEGQALTGCLGCIAVNFYLGGSVPEWVLLILMLIASLLCGAIWGLIPALFKAKWNTNETLFTLMMNYVATFLVSYCLIVWVPSGSSSLGKLKHGKLPTISLPFVGSHDYLLIIVVVVIMTALLFVYLTYSKHGYEISVVGESERTAKYVGISVKKVIIRTMLLSGLLCGLAGYLIGAGLNQSITTDSIGGQGFTAIMVAWLAKFNPIVMMLTSALIILLNQGADLISQNFDISKALPNVIVGIILFFIIGCEFFINYEIHFRGARIKAHKETEGVK